MNGFIWLVEEIPLTIFWETKIVIKIMIRMFLFIIQEGKKALFMKFWNILIVYGSLIVVNYGMTRISWITVSQVSDGQMKNLDKSMQPWKKNIRIGLKWWIMKLLRLRQRKFLCCPGRQDFMQKNHRCFTDCVPWWKKQRIILRFIRHMWFSIRICMRWYKKCVMGMRMFILWQIQQQITEIRLDRLIIFCTRKKFLPRV